MAIPLFGEQQPMPYQIEPGRNSARLPLDLPELPALQLGPFAGDPKNHFGSPFSALPQPPATLGLLQANSLANSVSSSCTNGSPALTRWFGSTSTFFTCTINRCRHNNWILRHHLSRRQSAKPSRVAHMAAIKRMDRIGYDSALLKLVKQLR